MNCNRIAKSVPYTSILRHLSFVIFFLTLATPAKAADIITTLPPLAGLIQMLEPDADVSCLLPANADPHHFQLSPRQVESLQQSTLLIRSSQDDGQWPSLKTSIEQFDLWPQHQEHHMKHAWLNPLAAQKILPKLAKKLQQIHPDKQQSIEKNLTLALQKTKQTWQAWQQLSHKIDLQQRGVIMQHPSWHNLFQALQIPIRNILESEQHGHEYGPHKLETALQQLQQYSDTLLIADSSHSNRALEWLQKHHSSSSIITLDALGTCGEDWQALMQHNLDLLQP